MPLSQNVDVLGTFCGRKYAYLDVIGNTVCDGFKLFSESELNHIVDHADFVVTLCNRWLLIHAHSEFS